MSAIDDLVRANDGYARAFPGPTSRTPKLHTTVIACMDARIDTFAALGLRVGDAHILRNGGGLVTEDVLRSLAIGQRALGTRAVMVLHHTDCGMSGFDDASFRAELAAESGEQPTWDVPGFTDIEAQLRRSITAIRECPWLPHRDQIRGFVFDVTTGRLTEVAG